MDILLIQPPRLTDIKKTRGTVPISLLHLSAYLRLHGHVPHILDFSAIKVESGDDLAETFNKHCRRKIDEINVKLIGINCFSTMHFPFVIKMGRIIREIDPELKICLGGCHPTLFAEDILTHCDFIDYIVLGEGEDSIVALADQLSHNAELNLESIQSFAFRRKDGTIQINERDKYLEDVSSLPMQAWDLINFPDYYSDYSTYYNPKNQKFNMITPIITSRSCPFNCSFCSVHLIMGRGYRKRKPTQVVDEIELLHREYGQIYFSFLDDNVVLDKKHIISICEDILSRGLDIQFAIPQGLYISVMDREVVDALYAAGCVAVSLPIESGSEYIRNSIIGKRISNEKIFDLVGWLKEKDIFTVGLFIMGFAEDTVDTLEETASLIKALNLDINGVNTLIPFPGTRIFDQAQRDDLFLIDVKDIWRGDILFDTLNREQFFIKPYSLELSILKEYRERFNDMYFFSERAKRLNKINY